MLRVEVSPPAGTRTPPGGRRLKVFAGSRSQIRRPQHPEVSFSLAPDRGRAWLLGCDCGEVGCWPLDARIEVTDDLVMWQDFQQPHRPERDYRSFGPFVFGRKEYDRAVADAVAALGADRR